MNSTELGLFDTVTSGPGAVTYGVGWALLALGTVFSLLLQQLAVAQGKKPDYPLVIARSAMAAVALGLFAFISQAVWSGTQSIAYGIYPETKLSALGKLLSVSATRFQDYNLSVFGLGSALKDGAVVLTGLASWLLALIAHWQLTNVQIAVYDVVFCFGPLMLGLSCFGLPTGRVWLTALLEVSSWSISMAVVYAAIDGQVTQYLSEAHKVPLLDSRFLDVINMLVFLSSLPLIVPVITGRLLGMSALGELSNATMGNPMVGRIAGAIREWMPNGPEAAPAGGGAHGAPAPTASTRRPGDL